MRKKLYAVVALMVFAIVGLSTVQLYWIENTVKLKESQFKSNVKSALKDIALQIEHAEIQNQVNELGLAQWPELYFDSTIVIHNGEEPLLTIRTDSAVTSSPDGTQRSTSQSVSFFNSNRKMSRRRMRHLMRQREQLINNTFSSMFNGSFNQSFISNLDHEEVKDIIANTLHSRGIEIPHQFAIFSRNSQAVSSNVDLSSDNLVQLVKSPYRIGLFDKGIFNDNSHLMLNFPDQRSNILWSIWPMLLGSGGLMIIMIILFAYTIATIFRQKKISEIKNDFIGNMTHELKTPISTISLACEALSDHDMLNSVSAKDRFVGIIKEENKRLEAVVENVLRTSIMDKGEMKLKKEPFDMVQLVKKACKNISVNINDKGGNLEEFYNVDELYFTGDKTHLGNAVYNLLDNAIKYSKETPVIKVTLQTKGRNLMLSVKDNGVGIAKENLGKIFDKLYRVPQGNLHDVKGYGLGLNYLKSVVEMHGGEVTVESKLNVGSEFTITLPLHD